MSSKTNNSKRKEKSLAERKEGRFIYYKGNYHLVHNYMTDVSGDSGYHGWFASPLHYTKDNDVEVCVGLGNWCYVVNGAFYKDPETDIMKKAYLSYLKHLDWTKGIQSTMNTDLITLNKVISFYQKLLAKTEVLLVQ